MLSCWLQQICNRVVRSLRELGRAWDEWSETDGRSAVHQNSWWWASIMTAAARPSPAISATILFTDLVNSTATRSALGEDAADALRRAHDALLIGEIARHDGQVIKSTGDGVFATFAGAAGALAAAVAIQQTADRYSRSTECIAPIALRIGLSVGDVVFEDGDCHGMPVVEAARLMSVAGGGEIICADIVELLARGRGGFEFTSVGSLELKGILDLVPASRVSWSPLPDPVTDGTTETPLPIQLSTANAFAAQPRDELKRLGDWAELARSGVSQIVWLVGPTGIGKTRLASEIANEYQREGGLVLYGHCDEDRSVPFSRLSRRCDISPKHATTTVWSLRSARTLAISHGSCLR